MLGSAILEHNKNNGAIFLDADGCYKIRVKAHAALTALTPYKVTFNGTDWVTAALPAGAETFLVGVALGSIASGDYGYVVIGGEVDDVVTGSVAYTAGHGVKIGAGAVADIGTAFAYDASAFGVVMETATTTSPKIFLTQHITGPKASTV